MPKGKKSRSSSKSGEDKTKKTKNSITKDNQPDVAADAPQTSTEKKGPVRSTRTMVATAKEGKAFLKTNKPKKRGGSRSSKRAKSPAKATKSSPAKSRSKSTKKGGSKSKGASKSPSKKGGRGKTKAAAEDTTKPAEEEHHDTAAAAADQGAADKEEKRDEEKDKADTGKRGRSKSTGKGKSGGKKKPVKRQGTMQATVKAAKTITKGVRGKRKRSQSSKKK